MTKRVEMALLVAIIVVGFALRWAGLAWGEGYRFVAINDEIESYRVALGLLAGEPKAFYIGQPDDMNVHVAGPLWALCWAGPLWAGGGPEAVTAAMIVLNTFGIFLVYRLAKKLFNGPVALWASLFCATAPWPVYYSVGCWNPQVMLVLGAALYLALWEVMTRPQSRHVFWVMLIPAAMLQFHMFGMFLFPGIVVLLGLRYAELNRRWLVTGLVAGMMLYLPYVVGESLHHWENTRHFVGEKKAFSPASFKSLTAPVMTLTNFFASAFGAQFADYRQFGKAVFGSFGVLLAFNALSIGLALLFVGDYVRRLFVALRDLWLAPRRALAAAPVPVFVSVLLFGPLLLFTLIGRNYNSRYVIVEYPLLFLLPGVFLIQVSRRWRNLILAAVVVTTGFNLVLTPLYYRYQGQTIADADYFMPSFRHMEEVRQKLAADAGPARRVRLDCSEITGRKLAKANYGMWALAKYVDVAEQYDRQRGRALAVQVYRAVPLVNLVDSAADVVYEGHGIALVKVPS